MSGTSGANGQVTTTVSSLMPAAANIFALHGSLMAQTPVTYRLPPAWQLGLDGSLTVVTRTLDAVRKNDLITYTITITNGSNGIVNDILLIAPIPNGNSTASTAVASLAQTSAWSSVHRLRRTPWSGQAICAAHTLSYAVRVLILEGQIVNQPRVHVNNEDTGIDLSSTVQVEAGIHRQSIAGFPYSERGGGEHTPCTLGAFTNRGSLSHAANEGESMEGERRQCRRPPSVLPPSIAPMHLSMG
jgi:hypothetical protein